PHDLGAGVFAVHVANERAVDLQRVHWEDGQRAQRRVAGAKVVDVQLNLPAIEFLHDVRGRVRVVDHDALGDLQPQGTALNGGIRTELVDLSNQVLLTKLAVGKIDADRERLSLRDTPLPIPCLPTRPVEHTFTQRQDQTVLRSQWNDLRGR